MALRVEVTVRLVGAMDTEHGRVEDEVFGYSHVEYLPILPEGTPDQECAKRWRDATTDAIGVARNSVIAQAAPMITPPPADAGTRPTGRSHRGRR